MRVLAIICAILGIIGGSLIISTGTLATTLAAVVVFGLSGGLIYLGFQKDGIKEGQL